MLTINRLFASIVSKQFICVTETANNEIMLIQFDEFDTACA